MYERHTPSGLGLPPARHRPALHRIARRRRQESQAGRARRSISHQQACSVTPIPAIMDEMLCCGPASLVGTADVEPQAAIIRRGHARGWGRTQERPSRCPRRNCMMRRGGRGLPRGGCGPPRGGCAPVRSMRAPWRPLLHPTRGQHATGSVPWCSRCAQPCPERAPGRSERDSGAGSGDRRRQKCDSIPLRRS